MAVSIPICRNCPTNSYESKIAYIGICKVLNTDVFLDSPCKRPEYAQSQAKCKDKSKHHPIESADDRVNARWLSEGRYHEPPSR